MDPKLKDLTHWIRRYLPDINESVAKEMAVMTLMGGDPSKVAGGCMGRGRVPPGRNLILYTAILVRMLGHESPTTQIVAHLVIEGGISQAILLLKCLNAMVKKRMEAGHKDKSICMELSKAVKEFSRKHPDSILVEQIRGIGFMDMMEQCSNTNIKKFISKGADAVYESLKVEDRFTVHHLWMEMQKELKTLPDKGHSLLSALLERLLKGEEDVENYSDGITTLFMLTSKALGMDPLDAASKELLKRPELWEKLILGHMNKGGYTRALKVVHRLLRTLRHTDFHQYGEDWESFETTVLDKLVHSTRGQVRGKALEVWFLFQPLPERLALLFSAQDQHGEDMRKHAGELLKEVRRLRRGYDNWAVDITMLILQVMTGKIRGVPAVLADAKSLFLLTPFVGVALLFIGVIAAAGIPWDESWIIAQFIYSFDKELYNKDYIDYLGKKNKVQPIGNIVLKTLSPKPPASVYLKNGMKVLENKAVKMARQVTSKGQRDDYSQVAALLTAVMEAWAIMGEFDHAETVETNVRTEFRRYRVLIREFEKYLEISGLIKQDEK